ncbi:MAG: hypothetical protein WBB32_13110 [Flavobacteriales bacterium]
MSNRQHLPRTDYSRMTPEARVALLADLEQHYFTSRYEHLPFDPTDMVVLAQQQLPRSPQVAVALACCTQHWVESELYSYFIDPEAPDRSRCAGGFMLHCPVLGMLLFDTDAQGGIVGVEYLSLVLQGEQPHERPPSPALRSEYWK